MGEFLRSRYADRWLRVHNLVGGKRLATRDDEQAELLYRNNVAASVLLGVGAECVAVASEWESIALVSRWEKAGKQPPWQFDEDDDGELVAMATLRFRPLRWRPSEFDEEIAAVARGELGRLVVFSTQRHVAYCPYDGGVDLITASPEDAAALRGLFGGWRGALVDGL